MAYYKKESAVARANILASEVGLVLKTAEIPSTLATNGVVAKGTIFPSNNSSATGIVFEDVTFDGDTKRVASVIVAGRIIEANLPADVDSDAKAALIASGIVFD